MGVVQILFLLLLGVFFLVAELIFLPGIAFGTILSMLSYGVAVYLAFVRLGILGGVLTIVAIILLSLVAVIFSLRAKTWQRFALKDKLVGSSGSLPAKELKVGDVGVAISRLSPMGKVEIGGKSYEAKSVDVYIDPKISVQVVGFENFTVIVRKAQ